VNRTDRLYAIVEELRAKAPRAWTARQLSAHFEVSTRTIERDVLALQEAGVPIWATPGPGGGYAVDPAMTLPPLNFTTDEAMAIAVALSVGEGLPFASGARTALRKIVDAMPEGHRDRARQLVGRVHRMAEPRNAAPNDVVRVVEQAILDGVVVELDYTDRDGARTRRPVEPFGLTHTEDDWYLMAWCRLRQAGRVFRFDRIAAATPTQERVPPRSLEDVAGDYAARLRPLLAE
jgi:predicted DNA-binding transcriptional regulator YafY